jgi:hypothetical protein
MWCYNSVAKGITLFSGSAMPLSPLFALPASRSDYISKAKINLNAPGISESLPPMFQGIKQ